MKINSSKIEKVEKWISVSITYKRKTFDVSVFAIDGKVEGSASKGLYTSYLTYFNENSTKIRQQQFDIIKKYVETNHK